MAEPRPASLAPARFDRASMIERLRSEIFDVVVIGGGITGAGVALDAASRGLRTALVERDDLAAGTSSKSSKLIHGGLRYLQNGDIKLVYQALHERQRLLRNAPHLVEVLPFVIPILTRDGVISSKISRALGSALWMYDLTGGWRIGRRHRRLSAAAVLEHAPTLDTERLAGGYLYYDAAADDARLTLTLALTAADHGAVIATRCPVTALGDQTPQSIDRNGSELGDGPALRTVTVDVDGHPQVIRCRSIVSATGVWADTITRLEHPSQEPSIRPARGIHVTIPWELIRNDVAIVIPVPKDRRSLFVVPWVRRADGDFEFAYVGTTDTDYEGELDDPPCTSTDIDYVLRALNHSFQSPAGRAIDANDVIAVWSGLRPLVRNAASERTADLSRNHRIEVSESGIIGVSGGKLTTYREMAEDTVDMVLEQLGLPRRRYRCRTRRLTLHGARPPVPPDHADAHLISRYGTDADQLSALIAEDPQLGNPIIPGLPYLAAEVIHAVRSEMALSLIDVVTRRTRAHLQHRNATERAAVSVATLMASELGWDEQEVERQVAAYRHLCEIERQQARIDDPGALETGSAR